MTLPDPQNAFAPTTKTTAAVAHAEPLPLSDAMAALQKAHDHNLPLEPAFKQVRNANPRVRRSHALLRDAGEIALHAEQWELAIEFSVRSLKALPRFGAAFKLMGKALRGLDRLDEAALCHRYGLPPAIRDQYFGDLPFTSLACDEASDEFATRHLAYPAARHELKPPFQMHPREIVELSARTLHEREAFTIAIPHGRLWFDSFNTVAWDSSGRVIQDACRGFPEVVQGSLGQREPQALSGCVCLLGNRNAVNYYHWMNDVLPKLEVLQASGFKLTCIDYFVVNALPHPFHHETLAALGIGEDRLHVIDQCEYVTGDEILVPHYGSNALGMGQGPWNPAFLKRTFLPTKAPREISQAATARLYISRGSIGARSISNEAELIGYLESIGFTTVYAEKLSVHEQAALYASASIVLGPHGAGLSNIAFCAPGTTVIELFNAHMAPCFWAISEVTGLRHVVHFCGEHDESTRPSDHEQYHRSADDRRHSAFAVNLDEIQALLGVLELGEPRAAA